jgi:hypothetical protein
VKIWSFFSDKRRFAWSLLSILKNNIVSAPFYYILAIIEYLELLFLFMIFGFIYFQHASTSRILSSKPNNSESSTFVKSVSDRIENSLTFIAQDQTTQIVIIGLMLFKNLAIIISIMGLASHFGSPEKAK